MTRLLRQTKKCAVCSNTHSYSVIGSTHRFGPCDLDMRPPEMQRSTMPYWVEECPFCGYVSADVSKIPYDEANPDSIEKYILSPEYKNVEGLSFSAYLSEQFYKLYMLACEFKNTDIAFFALLNAAWACDDEGDLENAIICRKKSLEFLDVLISENKESYGLMVQKADILRRSGEFDALIKEYENAEYPDELLNKIISFQLEKARIKDDGCYTVADVK